MIEKTTDFYLVAFTTNRYQTGCAQLWEAGCDRFELCGTYSLYVIVKLFADIGMPPPLIGGGILCCHAHSSLHDASVAWHQWSGDVGVRYMVVDCGGGTVDITVHEMDSKTGKLNELHKATGGPHGSTGMNTLWTFALTV